MKASITLFFLTTLCATFAVIIPDGEQYFAQLYARFGTFQVGRAMHPYNIFTYKNSSYQSGGVLAYSNFRSIVWKKELLTQVNSTTAILEVSMQTLDGNDLFPEKIPLQRSAVADWIYASDLWFLIGFSGNNDSVTDGISFQHNENSIISIESVQANAYNNYTLIDITGIQSQLQQEPLGYIVYFPNAVGRGINRVVATFTVSEHTLHPNDPVYPPPNRDPTLQSFCDTLNTNCENCNSHPSCVYCVFNESIGFRQMRSSCLLNNEDFTTRGCIQLGGTLQEECKVRYTGSESVTDSTTSLSPLLSTTSVQIECLGCEITKQVDESPANSKLSKGAVIAISLSACVVVLLTVGILFVFLKRAALVKSNTVQMQEISVEKQTAETAGN